MRTYTLALNDRKTEVIHFFTNFFGHDPVPPRDLHVGGVSISPSNAMCNLGVIMDSAGTMSNQVSRLCKSASFALRKVSIVRNFLDQSTTLKYIHAFRADNNVLYFVLSYLPYCYFGVFSQSPFCSYLFILPVELLVV